jgi:hypothetical protein
VVDSADEDDEHRQTIIVGSEKEFAAANQLMLRAGMEERVLGRVEVNGSGERNSIGNLYQLNHLLKMYPIREVILCEGKLSFVKLIDTLKQIPTQTRVKIHASYSESIIGSESKDLSGKAVSANTNLRLARTISLRNKRFVGVILSLFFIITFPIHLLLQKKRIHFFSNVFLVLTMQKDWIGYASTAKGLPQLKPGVLSTTGVPNKLNLLPLQSLNSSDNWYATDYEVIQDVRMVLNGYKYLGES